MPTWTDFDRDMMRRALLLAAKGRGLVEPNPMVGCVLTRGRRIVGEGFHHRFGGPHAEVHALAAAKRAALGATAYITLEPCSHIGKTPPCVDALLRARVRRCVVAVRDPNPIVAGRGLRALRRADVAVDVGLLAADAKRLMAPFFTVHTQGRPYVILKWAQSLDGKIATASGDSKWITSPASRKRAHELRARVDAIIVGINTVLADNPELTARHVLPQRIATRIVLDSKLRTPPESRLVTTAKSVPTILVTTPHGGRSRNRPALERSGVEILVLPRRGGGVDPKSLLRELHGRGMTNVMVEGGGQVLSAFLREGLADEAEIYVAPRLIGGDGSIGPLPGVGAASMTELIGIDSVIRTDCGPDSCYNLVFGRKGGRGRSARSPVRGR